MRKRPRLLLCSLLLTTSACGEESKEPEAPKAVAVLDIRNSGEASIPGGSTIVEGKWSVSGEKKELRVLAVPLEVSRLEFGPEIRERGATIFARGKGPGDGRLQSRWGAGLYGKNGFHLRLVPLKDEIELVRRGAVLHTVERALEPGRSYTIELTVRAEEDEWVIEGHVWETGAGPEGAAAIGYRIYDDELEFPLAGRAFLTATPFSGEPVSFSLAEVYPEGYVRQPSVQEGEREEEDPVPGTAD